MTITQFEEMAFEAIQKHKIKDFDKLLCSFQKWHGSETNCYVAIYTKDKAVSGTSLNAIAAINQAIEEILIFQNGGKERVFTNE